MKTLYHYTSIERWELIKEAGRLTTTESNISQRTNRAGPDVVWLTTDADCSHGHGISTTLDGTDKTRIRIAVNLPNREVHKWREWAVRHGMGSEWMRVFINASNGGASTWRVTERPILSTRWVSVVDRLNGATLWLPPTLARQI